MGAGKMYKYKRRNTKRYNKYRKSHRQKKSGLVVSLGRQIFPKSFMTKHRYSVTESLLAGISTPDLIYYSCNGMYDPESAVGGHSVLGFDQLTPIYDHYTVLGSKITVRCMPSATDIGSGGVIVGCFINDDASAVGTYDTILEQGGAVSRILGPRDGDSTVTFTKNWSSKKYFGVKNVRDNSQLKGTVSANPTDGAYFTVFCQGIDPASNPSSVYVNVLIEYVAIWSEPKTLTQS